MAKLIRLYLADEVVITAIFTQRFRIDAACGNAKHADSYAHPTNRL
jgi:hypothetical protein